MEIILKEDIIGLGYKNDIVNVKSGYGRNYLIPTGKGVIASPSAKKVGDYEATVHFHKEVEVKVPVKVVAENAPVEAVEAPVEEAPVAEAAAEAPAAE